MEPSERLEIDDVVTLLRSWRANEFYGTVTIHVQQGRIHSLRPEPILQTATQFRRHLPRLKQEPG